MTILLDSSLVIPLLADEHEHHGAARSWFADLSRRFATCPSTQGSVIRYSLRRGRSVASALQSLRSLVTQQRHDFWADDLPYPQVRFDGVVGHRQVTDAYLAELARRHEGRVATFDEGMAELHADIVELVPTS